MSKRSTTLLLVLALVPATQSCITSGTATTVNGMSGEVIERSREKVPSWAALRPFTLHDQNLAYGYIHFESQHNDLPFGIKTTQINALAQGKDVFKGALNDAVQRAADVASVTLNNNGYSGQGITAHVESACEQAWSSNAKVADIFFEKFRPSIQTEKGAKEFYNIYVMVEVPKGAMTESLRAIARRLKGSSNPDLQKVGTALDNRVSLVH